MKNSDKKPEIISASRRTDIPAFYSHWFIKRLHDGFCYVRNPFNRKILKVILEPQTCQAIFFWTRNPEPLLPHLKSIHQDGFKIIFHFTVIKYPSVIETHTPALDTSIQRFIKLSKIVGKQSILWRYDPIMQSTATSIEDHIDQFSYIAEKLEGYTSRCYFSFVDFYGKTKRRLACIRSETGIKFSNPALPEKRKLAGKLAQIAKRHGIRMYACCEDQLVNSEILKAHCIDPEILSEIGIKIKNNYPLKPSRKGCGCFESVDIGAYDFCLYGCEYCYANRSHAAALRRFKQHDPDNPLLIP